MGLLRLILACSVVCGHAGAGVFFTGPEVAVQTFYIISGFYIAMILDRTVAYRSIWVFYFSRYLRLWPSYAAIAFATLVAKALVQRSFFNEFANFIIEFLIVIK